MSRWSSLRQRPADDHRSRTDIGQPEIDVEVEIDADAHTVWKIVTDPPLPARHSTELIEAHWGHHPSGAPGLGSTIIGRSRIDGFEWTTESHVTAWDIDARFEWAVRDPVDSAARWAFELEHRRGRTTLRQRYRIGPGRSMISDMVAADSEHETEIILGRLTAQRAMMRATLEAVKARAEAQPPTDR